MEPAGFLANLSVMDALLNLPARSVTALLGDGAC
jgi:hypothetical protein